MLEIYCGNGKGKTTAAMGLAVRAHGSGMNTAVFQFLKNGSSSEIAELQKLGIETECCTECTKFTFRMNDDEKAAVKRQHDAMLENVRAFITQNENALVVMDEFLDAYNSGLADRTLSEEIILSLCDRTEIILTGRNPAEVFTDAADYLSEINAVKHPYTKGVTARKGIEY